MAEPRGSLPRAVIFGLAGPVLEPRERTLFAAADPLGFILFSRNIRTPAQVRALVDELRCCVGRADAPILIDQEGGRVARLRPPHWRFTPAAACFARLAKRDAHAAVDAARLNARLTATELSDLGITVNCAPVLDLPCAGAHLIIGDRAVGDTPEGAASIGRAICEGLLAGGVLPVIKHIPGHGRAPADSHQELPVVKATRAELQDSDFVPFRTLREMPWAMTAHVLYCAIDPDRAATTSSIVVETIIRGDIGFGGVLVSDDVCMGALTGSVTARARAALVAGCDVVLHCSGDFAEMRAVAAECPPLSAAAVERLCRGEAMRATPQDFDAPSAEARLAILLEGATA